MSRWRLTFELDVPLHDGSNRCSVELEEGQRCIVGRSKTAQVAVNSGKVSREHLSFDVVDGQVFAEDLGSSNGSWLNGQRIKRSAVKVGDKIHAGAPRIILVALESLGA